MLGCSAFLRKRGFELLGFILRVNEKFGLSARTEQNSRHRCRTSLENIYFLSMLVVFTTLNSLFLGRKSAKINIFHYLFYSAHLVPRVRTVRAVYGTATMSNSVRWSHHSSYAPTSHKLFIDAPTLEAHMLSHFLGFIDRCGTPDLAKGPKTMEGPVSKSLVTHLRIALLDLLTCSTHPGRTQIDRAEFRAL
jgi:hypothetical protein